MAYNASLSYAGGVPDLPASRDVKPVTAPSTSSPHLGPSHTDRKLAGWRPDGTDRGGWPAKLKERRNPRWTEFSWLTTRALLDSANDQIAKNVHDLVNARRMRWVAAMRASGVEEKGWNDLVSSHDLPEDFSCLIVGDPGEGDGSQYAVAEALQSQADGTSLMLLMSDVIYPAGDVNDYWNSYYLPYAEYRRPGGKAPDDSQAERPILGVPGNHDWYDGLAGFMFHFCGAELLPPTEYRKTSFTFAERIARLLWQQSSRPERAALLGRRDAGRGPEERRWWPAQPGPYFVIDTPRLMLVCIDTGITGTLDREQGDWLRRVSAKRKDKVLITGKPLIVDGKSEPGRIEWGPEPPKLDCEEITVDAIVRDPENRYVAALGGDIHNYQRYTVRPKGQPGSRERIEYLVAGGGGAYLTATHRFAPVDMTPPKAERIGENDFYCYPSRGDSVAFYSRRYMQTVRRWALSSLALVAAVTAIVLWVGALDQIDGASWHELWKVALMSLGTLVGLAGVLGLGAVAGKLAGKGYGMFAGLTFAATLAVLGVAALASWWSEGWSELWPVVPVTLGVILVPLLAVILGYYYRGFGPRFTADLALVLAVTIPAAALIGDGLNPDTGEGWLLFLGLSLLVVAMAVPAVGRLLNEPISSPRRQSRAFHRVTSLLVLAWIAVPIVLADHWVVWSVAIAAGVVLLVVVVALWLFLVRPRGALALVAGKGDPDAIYRLTAERFGRRPDQGSERARGARAVGRFDPSRWLVDYVLGHPTRRPWYRAFQDRFVSEIGDTNEPPLFRHFLRLSIRGEKLVIECFAVTGWAGEPSVEDQVELTLKDPGPPSRHGDGQGSVEETAEAEGSIADLLKHAADLLAEIDKRRRTA